MAEISTSVSTGVQCVSALERYARKDPDLGLTKRRGPQGSKPLMTMSRPRAFLLLVYERQTLCVEPMHCVHMPWF